MIKASVASTCGLLRAPLHQHIKEPPSSTSRWRPGGSETPTGNLSPRHTILSRSALSDVSTPAPASKEVSRYRATKGRLRWLVAFWAFTNACLSAVNAADTAFGIADELSRGFEKSTFPKRSKMAFNQTLKLSPTSKF
nr:hypothetical protein Itr_chr03CG04300 [Ipomoea trifida]GMD87914.1 hypothetical protein Iba_chr14cCG1980 [Ipomoea batatas]